MRLLIIISIISVIWSPNIYGQPFPDSLVVELDTIMEPADKIEYLKRKARETLKINQEWAIELNKLALCIAEESKDNYLMGQAKSEEGILYSILKNFQRAKEPIKQAIHLFKEINDSTSVGYQYRNLGLCYLHQENQDSAIIYFYESLSYLDLSDDRSKLFYGLTCLNLGKSFNRLGNIAAAHSYIDAGIDIFKGLKDTFNLASAYNGKALIMMGELDAKSGPIIDESMQFVKYLKDTFNWAIHMHNKAWYMEEFGDPAEALDTLKRAYELYQIMRSPIRNLDAHFYLSFGRVYLKLNKLNQAEYYLKEALTTSDSSNSMFKPSAGPLIELAILYKKKGDYKQSLAYYEQYLEVFEDNIALKNTNLIDFYEKDLAFRETKKQKEILEQQNIIKENELAIRNRNIILLVMGLVGLAFILIILAFFNRQLKIRQSAIEKNKNEIEAQRHELQILNDSKENLISIIGHDLRGPLNNLDQILELIPGNGDILSKESEDILSLSNNSIKEMQHLLNNLLVWAKTQRRNLSIVPEKTTLGALVNETLNLYSSSIQFNKIQVINNLSDDVTVLVDPNTIEVVIRNLLNNSVKYSPKGGTIKITGSNIHDKVFLSIEDECGGLPDQVVQELFEEDRSQHTDVAYQIKRGFGLKLCHDLLKANNANWSYTPTEKGSLITIVFRKEHPSALPSS